MLFKCISQVTKLQMGCIDEEILIFIRFQVVEVPFMNSYIVLVIEIQTYLSIAIPQISPFSVPSKQLLLILMVKQTLHCLPTKLRICHGLVLDPHWIITRVDFITDICEFIEERIVFEFPAGDKEICISHHIVVIFIKTSNGGLYFSQPFLLPLNLKEVIHFLQREGVLSSVRTNLSIFVIEDLVRLTIVEDADLWNVDGEDVLRNG